LYFYPFLIVIFVACMSATYGSEQSILVGFITGKNLKSAPEGWESLTYLGKAKNDMSLIKEGKRTVLYVKSLNSASALLKRLDVDPESFPILAWRWKVIPRYKADEYRLFASISRRHTCDENYY